MDKYYTPDLIEAGLDEAGRGSLIGSVFAAAVILPKNFFHPLLNDSKKVSKKNREQLKIIIEKEAIDFCVARVNQEEIDKINILNASIKAMHLAIDELKIKPELLLIDGNKFKNYNHIKHICIVKGDSKFATIAAASILAKTYRDDYMKKLHTENPLYEWDKNKGYGTKKHKALLNIHGLPTLYRKSFKIK